MFLIPAEQKSKLHLQWSDLIRGLAGSARHAMEVWTLLDKHYSEPQRSFHNLSHIQSMLKHAEERRADIQNFSVVSLAIWFHDMVYDTHANNNELKSAELAGELMMRMEINPTIIMHVQQCILATARHEVADFKNRAADIPLFLDIALTILGAPKDVYQQYSRAIRNEFRWLEAPAYRAGRLKVLKRFADREQLYFHPIMAAQFDAQARANIAWEIKKLTFV
ncbi:MAG: hypothetical protein V4495_28515 [Pseudomonadota bacterium]